MVESRGGLRWDGAAALGSDLRGGIERMLGTQGNEVPGSVTLQPFGAP